MKLAVIHPPIAPPKRPINWAAYQACGTIVPPMPRHRGRRGVALQRSEARAPLGHWKARLFVVGIVTLITVPMLWLMVS